MVKKKEVVGYFVPKIKARAPQRKLGILKGKATAVFNDGFKMTEEEFAGL